MINTNINSQASLVTCKARKGDKVAIYALPPGTLLYELDGITFYTFDRSGNRLLTIDSVQAHMRNAADGSIIYTFTPATPVQSFELTSDDNYIIGISTARDRGMPSRIYSWNAGNGQLVYTITVPSLECHALDAHNNRIATGENDGIIRIWNLQDGSLINTIATHTSYLGSLLFDNKDDYIITNGLKVQVWKVRTGVLISTIDKESTVRWENLQVNPAGGVIAGVVRKDNVSWGEIWDIASGKRICKMGDDVNCLHHSHAVEFNTTGNYLFYYCRAQGVSIHNGHDGSLIATLSGSCRSVCYDKTATRVVMAPLSGGLALYQLVDEQLLKSIKRIEQRALLYYAHECLKHDKPLDLSAEALLLQWFELLPLALQEVLCDKLKVLFPLSYTLKKRLAPYSTHGKAAVFAGIGLMLFLKRS